MLKKRKQQQPIFKLQIQNKKATNKKKKVYHLRKKVNYKDAQMGNKPIIESIYIVHKKSQEQTLIIKMYINVSANPKCTQMQNKSNKSTKNISFFVAKNKIHLYAIH